MELQIKTWARLLLVGWALAATQLISAQGNVVEPEKPSKYVEVALEKPELIFFQGFTLGVDLFGPAQYMLSDFGCAEASLRLNLKNTYFPVAELGFARCNKIDDNTNVSYKTNAPYLRLGLCVC